ncbi:calycin-like domain-containing protein [Bacteroides sp.]
MKRKLLSTILAFMAITISLPTYAQISQEAQGTYNGELVVTVDEGEPVKMPENIYLTATDDTHVTLEIRDFKFGGAIIIGTITVENVELQKEGNTINLKPTTCNLTLAIVGEVKVSLEQSTIKNNTLTLSLQVNPEGGDLDILVDFEGTITSTGIADISTNNKPTAYYDAATDALVAKGAENQKYEIYNVAGVQTLSGVITTDQINVSALSRGLYLAKIGNSTVKFIKK